ncbi:MAG TPA: EAL domain-containing protein [Candidatus Sulfotelmatobacter sp.]|nr:EAL domain-containing protein [Candidatus Sulfotelmatobacter sp.]
MPQDWYWIPLAVLTALAIYQQIRIYQIYRDSKKKEELFQIVTENAADMIALVDVKGHRLYNSPAYQKILGYSPAELGETSAFEQIHPEDRYRVLEAAREARQTGQGKRLEYRIKHKDGSWRVLESISGPIRNSKGEVTKLVIVNRDITERKRAEQQLEHNLFHDPLTGLPNRRFFLDRLQTAFLRAHRDPRYSYALLLANVDHFKAFNESLGTAGGDRVLQEVGRAMAACLRDDDDTPGGNGGAVSRLGGDEFTIILDGISDPSDALRTAKRIQGAVAQPFVLDSREMRVSLSTGIALSTMAHQKPEEVLKDADVAMRRAKALGGSRCEVLDEAMHTVAEGRLRLEGDLRAALAGSQFRIHYQPVVQLNTRTVSSFEALLRWDHPRQGLISPYRFLEAAEDAGILVPIGHWLVLQVCRQLQDWEARRGSDKPINITVNVSARQFADAHLANDIQEALRETGLEPSRLQLEMTETIACADPKLTITVLAHLKHLGIGVILDDFGIGSASLRGLRQFPVDALKIDRSLIHEMQSDRAQGELVEMIIIIAHKMGVRAVAEGVETARQFERLLELGCDFGQGYYFSQPLEPEAALQFMNRQAAAAGRSG